MTRLIDADALIEAMEERKKIWLSKCEYNDAIREVKEAPTVEAYIFEQVQDLVALNKKLSEERPHGECNQCRHYEGVHGANGHAPCSFWGIGGVLSIDYCSRFEKAGEKE